jgi:hypothetical protein
MRTRKLPAGVTRRTWRRKDGTLTETYSVHTVKATDSTTSSSSA